MNKYFYLSSAIHTSSVLLQRPDHRLFKDLDWDRVESGEYAIVDPLDPNAILYLPERDYIIQTRVSQTQGNKPVILATPRDKRPASVSVDTPIAVPAVPEKSGPDGASDKDGDSKSETPALDTSSSSTTQTQNSPTFTGKKDLRWRLSRLFKNPFHFVKRVQTRSVHGMVIENQVVVELDTLVPLFRVWAYYLHRRIVGLSSDRTLQNNVLIFVRKLYHSYRHHGINALILRLKVMLFVINSFIAGEKLKTTDHLKYRIRLSNGLPSMLPLPVRQSIRNLNPSTIVIWGSLLYLYRAISGKHKKPDLSGIVAPFDLTPEYESHLSKLREFVPVFTKWLFTRAKIDLQWVQKNICPAEFVFSASAGPNTAWSLTSAPLDTLYWVLNGWKDSVLYRYMHAIKSTQLLGQLDTNQFSDIATKLIEMLIGPVSWNSIEDADTASLDKVRDALKSGRDASGNKLPKTFRTDATQLHCGRLHALKEPAGKVRIIAIVDIWTQTFLRPLHDVFFKILKALPSDATFDQQEGVNSFAKEGHKEIFSYDLTAATDTIPWVLYGVLLEGILGKDIVDAWLSLLRSRPWLTPNWEYDKTCHRTGRVKTFSKRITVAGKHIVKYGTGQPMGAYSSWGALALLHHGIVQYSAFLAGLFPFSAYRVLGDDIVIAGKAVAEKYLLVCSQLGIKIGLPKSFTSSEGFFNFASQSFLGEQNLSPFSFADELASNSAKSRFGAVYQALGRGYLDPEADNFFARVLRFTLIPSLTKRVETARRSGVVHNAVHYVSGLVFGALLSGSKAFGKSLQELTAIEVGSGLVSPGLPLFCMSLKRYAQSSVKDIGDSLLGLRTYQGLILEEYKSTLNKVEARIKTLQSIVSLPFVSKVYLAHIKSINIKRIHAELKEKYESALSMLEWADIDFSRDTVLKPDRDLDMICDEVKLPRWTLDFKKCPKIVFPDTVLLGDREHKVDPFAQVFLGNAHSQRMLLEDTVSEVTTLSKTLQDLRYDTTVEEVLEVGPIDVLITAELRDAMSQPHVSEMTPEEKAKHLSDMREQLVTQYRKALERFKDKLLTINHSLDRSSLSILLPRHPQEAVRDFDRSLISILDIALKARKQNEKPSMFSFA
jgi:hypothetical protein